MCFLRSLTLPARLRTKLPIAGPYNSIMQRGYFLSLDGMDGAGKSTQCVQLADWLRTQHREVVLCHDPGGTEVGQALREIVLHHRGQIGLECEALLFMASRAQLVREVIRPALERGQIVLADRFLLANVVYQGHAGGLNPGDLWQVGAFCTGGLEPDMTLILDLPLDIAATRRKPAADRMESRGDAYFSKVRAGFLAEAARRPERCRIIDASGDAASVQQKLREAVAKNIDK